MVDKHEEITLPIVLSCNYQSDNLSWAKTV